LSRIVPPSDPKTVSSNGRVQHAVPRGDCQGENRRHRQFSLLASLAVSQDNSYLLSISTSRD
jgi:hypothetical protein